MSKHLKTEAIILKKKALLNKDLLTILFTREEGKVSAIAKGVKKITSRRSPHLQTGNLLKIQFNKKGDRYYLEETNLISGFSDLKKDHKKINTLYQYFFILERLLPENQKENEVYDLTKSFLIKLSQNNSNSIMIQVYLNKLLKLLGYAKEDHSMPDLESIIEDLINEKIPSFNI